MDHKTSLAKHVANTKLGSIKPHHMLMQQVLPKCLQGL
jgi:hypothetical protein